MITTVKPGQPGYAAHKMQTVQCCNAFLMLVQALPDGFEANSMLNGMGEALLRLGHAARVSPEDMRGLFDGWKASVDTAFAQLDADTSIGSPVGHA